MGGIEYPWAAAMATASAINLGTASPNIGSSTASRAVWPVIMQSTETVILAINLRQSTSRRSWWDGLASLAYARIVLSFTILRSEEHTSELQSLMRISYAVLCLKQKKITVTQQQYSTHTRTKMPTDQSNIM